MRTKPSLSEAECQTIMAAAKDEARKNKWPVAIAIVDEAGYLLHLERLDGARSTVAESAHLKARSAALTHRPGKFWDDMAKERPGLTHLPGVFPVQGSLPITVDGVVIGAVGVGGVQSHEDEQVAAAGIKALKL